MKKQIFVFVVLWFLAFGLSAQSPEKKTESVSIEGQDISYSIGPTGNSEIIEKTYLKANDDNGRVQLSAYQLPYDGQLEEVVILEAGLKQDGREELVELDQIKETTIPGATSPGVSEYKLLTIPFPGVKTGGTIWVTAKKKSKKETILGGFSEIFTFGLLKPEKNSVATFTSQIPLYTSVYDPEKVLSVKTLSDVAPYRYEIKLNKPVFSISKDDYYRLSFEEMKKKLPVVHISSHKVWQSFLKTHRGYYGINGIGKPEMNTPEMNQVVPQIKIGASTSETVENILLWMANNITYSGRWVRPGGGWISRLSFKTIQTKVGDCKDFARLFLTIAGRLGIEAEPVYVNVSAGNILGRLVVEPIDEKNPLPMASYFNHVVVRYKNGSEWVTIDPGRNVGDSVRTPYFLIGAWALNLREEGPLFKISAPKDNYASVKLQNQLSLRPDGSLSGETTMVVDGEMANYMKSLYFSSGEEKLKEFSKILLPTYTPKNVQEVKLPTVTRNTGAMELKFSYQIPKEEHEKASGYWILPPIPAYKEAGYAGEDPQVFTFPITYSQTTHIPQTFLKDEVEKDCYLRGPVASASRKLANRDDGVLITDTVTMKSAGAINSATKDEKDAMSSHRGDIYSCVGGSFLKLEKKTVVVDSQKNFEQGVDLSKPYDLTPPEKSQLAWMKRLREIDYRLEKDPKNNGLWRARAGILYLMAVVAGNAHVKEYYDEAIENLKDVLTWAPSDAGVLALIGTYYSYMSKAAEAQQFFNQAYKIDPINIDVLFLGGMIFNVKGKFLEAEKYWLSALSRQDPFGRKPHILFKLSNLYCDKLNQCEKALPLYDRMIAASPKDPWTLHNAAVAYGNLKDYKKAIEFERKALAVKEFGAAKMGLSWAQTQEASYLLFTKPETTDQDLAVAEKYLVDSYKYDPKNSDVIYMLGIVYKEYGERQSKLEHLNMARNYFNQLVQTSPSYAASNEIGKRLEWISKIEGLIKSGQYYYFPGPKRKPANK